MQLEIPCIFLMSQLRLVAARGRSALIHENIVISTLGVECREGEADGARSRNEPFAVSVVRVVSRPV